MNARSDLDKSAKTFLEALRDELSRNRGGGTGVGRAAVQATLRDRSRPPKIGKNGEVIFRHGDVERRVGWMSLVACGALGVLRWKVPADDDSPAWIAIPMIAFAALGAWMLWANHRASIEISRTGIVERTVLRRTRRVAWSDVKSVTFNRLMQQIEVEGSSGWIAFSISYNGIGHFWNTIEANLPERMWSNARHEFLRFVGYFEVEAEEIE